MKHESSSGIQGLWQSQPTQPPSITPEEIRSKMHRFERRIFRRNIREYAGGIFTVVAFGVCAWKLPAPLFRLGAGLSIAGVFYVMFQLHRRASTSSAPGDLGVSTCLEFHRRTLERQRDALRDVGSWYLLPLVPGLFCIMLGTAINQWKAHPADMGGLVMGYSILAGLVGVVFFAIWKLNQRGADKLQIQIDEMTRLSSRTEDGESQG